MTRGKLGSAASSLEGAIAGSRGERKKHLEAAHAAVTGLHSKMGGTSAHIAKPTGGKAADHMMMASQELKSAADSAKKSHGAGSPEHKAIQSAIKSLTAARLAR